jgi:hypothetical protein
MKHLLRYLVLVPIVTAPLLSGCKKDEPATPATPTTGSLNGTVTPAGSATQVTARNSSGASFSATPDPITGAFSFANLAAGQYTLSFTMGSGYKPLTDAKLSVVAGQNATVGTLQVTSDGIIKSGNMRWTTAGTTYTATVVEGAIDRQTGVFRVKGKSSDGTLTDEVSLWRNNGFAGVGNYKLSYAEYRRNTAMTNTVYFDRTTANPLVITQYDEATGTVAGTFSFNAMTGDLGGISIFVTNGTFSLRF